MVDDVRQRQQQSAPGTMEQDIQEAITAMRAGDQRPTGSGSCSNAEEEVRGSSSDME